VNIQKLGKQLRREIVTNPRKAIFLGILIVIGLYFWMPFPRSEQIHGEASSKSGVATQNMLKAPEPTTSSGGQLAGNTEKKSTRYSWKEVVKLMGNDPRTLPAEPLTINKDPFQGPKETLAKEVTEEQIGAKLPPITPASLGMTLTSTLIGTKSGLARIGGRTYELGQIIELEKDGRKYKFILAEIQDRRVLLEMEGEQYELNIPEPGASNRMVLGNVEH
jgi:hypothetical protein